HQARIPVKSIPGPSALTAAVAVSGFSGDAIIFEGRLPSTNRRLAQYLSRYHEEPRTLVFYVGSRALTGLLHSLALIFPGRQTAIAMNLTTGKETICRGKPDELLNQIGPMALDSAVTVVIEGYPVGLQRKKKGRRISRTIRL